MELIHASKRGPVEWVRSCIEAGADVNYQIHHNGNTPLMYAAWYGNVAGVVRELIQSGARLNMQNFKGDTALIFAARHGHTREAELLVNARASLEIRNENESTTLIEAARSWYNLKVMRVLIQAGAEVNAQDHIGYTALIYATSVHNEEMVRLLLDAGANPNIIPNKEDPYTSSALSWAVMDGDISVVDLLIQRGANILKTDVEWAATERATRYLKRLLDTSQGRSLIDEDMIVKLFRVDVFSVEKVRMILRANSVAAKKALVAYAKINL